MSSKKNRIDGLELKIARIRKGLTLAELGRRVGVSHMFLSYLERGERNPGPETYEKLVRELGEIPKAS